MYYAFLNCSQHAFYNYWKKQYFLLSYLIVRILEEYKGDPLCLEDMCSF